MKPHYKLKFLFLAGLVATLASCSTERLVSQNTDDVYFKNVEAVKVTYTARTQDAYQSDQYADRNGYDRNDDYYYDGYEGASRFDRRNFGNNYSWRDYYYMDRFNYDPFFGSSSYLGFNNFYGNGFGLNMGFNMGFNSPFNNFNMPFYNNGFYNQFGSFYGNSGYGGIYSFYNQGYYGNYYGDNNGGYYGNGYYGNGYGNGYYGTTRDLKPRPTGGYDNTGSMDRSGRIPIPESRATRPNSGGDNSRPRTESSDGGGNYDPYGRPTRSSGSSTDRRTRDSQPQSQPSSRPSRPSRDSGSDSRGGRSSEPTSQPTSRPTRSDTPSYTPSRSTESSGGSSSGSSSGGRSSSGRPSR